MNPLKLFLSIGISILFALNICAQKDPDVPVPVDPEIRSGRLENGLTYFIRHNREPEKRASFYLIQNAGAILENDDQDGFAHFLEHMAFNGTRHFPGKSIINSLEKHGVAFGYNINAYTGFDETVYNLTDVPVEAPGLVDTCLLILNDWTDYISLTEKEIDLERGVIAEEWRTRKNASTRMIFEVIPVVLKGSRYAERDIIGDPDVIKNFSCNALRSFYHDWYRTDLQAIVVVGDVSVDDIETKIKTLFSKIRAVENPVPRPAEEVPYHKETYFVLARDREAPRTLISVVTLHKSLKPEDKNLKYLRDTYAVSLMNSMINTRINELLQKGDPPFVAGSVSLGEYYARGYDAFTIAAAARKNEEALALEAVYAEAERAKRFGFTDGELNRAKANMLSSYENYYRQKDKIDNDAYVADIQNYFLSGEPLPSVDFEFEFLREVLPGITSVEISEKFGEAMIEENRTVIIQGLDGDDIIHLSEQEALNILSKVKNSMLAPYEDTFLEESLVKEDLHGSTIIKTTPLPQFDAIEWTLSNNARVVYRKADYEKDNVLLSAFSFGGVSKVNDDEVLTANILPQVVTMYGAGDYDNVTLQKMLAGKKAAISVSLAETTEMITGSSTPKDFETMMQLLYLRFARPRFDIDAHKAIISRFAAFVGNMEKDPNKLKSDTISLIKTGYHPRTPVFSKENIEKISLEDIRKIYTDRFNSADEFIFFIVGNIGQEEARLFTEKYIGSLPAGGRSETWSDRKVEQPKGKIFREISFPLTIPKSTVFISFAKDLKYVPNNYLGLEVIKGILDIVYTEKVREDEGGTYGVGIMLSARKRPSQAGEGIITFDCDPARAEELKTIIYKEIGEMVRNGPSRENLIKAVNNLLKTREESKLHNTYWMNTLTGYYSYGINSNDPDNHENILKSFTIGDIRKISRKMFRKADVVDLVFRPAG